MMMTEQGMERDPEDTFDRVLCGELFWQAPPDLSSRLLELVPQAVAFNFNLPEPLVEAPAVLIRPRTWYTSLVSLLTFLAVVVSLAVALQFYTVVGAHLGVATLWEQVTTLATAWLNWLYAELPLLKVVVSVVGSLYEQVHWLLIALVLWLTLDGWSSDTPMQQQQASG